MGKRHGFAGTSTTSRDLLIVRIKSSSQPIEITACQPHKMFYTLQHDACSEVIASGFDVLECCGELRSSIIMLCNFVNKYVSFCDL